MLVGDFNAKESELCLLQFLFEINLNTVKEPTCFKKLSNPISMFLLDFNKTVVNVFKHTFHRFAPKELVYNRDQKFFDKIIFKRGQEDKLNQINEYKHFEGIYLEIPIIHAPVKDKLPRTNKCSLYDKGTQIRNYEKV